MTASALPNPGLVSRWVSRILTVKPLFNVAKSRARAMMVQRAKTIGLDWHQEAALLRSRQGDTAFSPDWEAALATLTAPNLRYPSYYLQPFHAYEAGNLSWEAAMEVEVASKTVHSQVWSGRNAPGDPQGDARLRQSYHTQLQAQLPRSPQRILDIGCSTGLSSFALQAAFPAAWVTGVDLSPHFLAIAQYRDQQRHPQRSAQGFPRLELRHAAGEETGLPAETFDLVSVCLVFHELPQTAAIAILHEARRLLKPGGHLSLMDMNPHSAIYAQMPPYLLTLLKSTEPYIDEYFSLDIAAACVVAGFQAPTITANSPRHRTVIAQVA